MYIHNIIINTQGVSKKYTSVTRELTLLTRRMRISVFQYINSLELKKGYYQRGEVNIKEFK